MSAEALIPAPPAKVFAILADYRHHHQQVVPPEYFRNMEVLEGGTGAGTRTRFEVHLMGSVSEVRHSVTEPEPGRVLMETDHERSTVTTFTVDPVEGGKATRLTIWTELATRGGVAGALERWFVSKFLRRVYRMELARIADYAPSAVL